MSYKWKPNATQRKEFAERMKNPEEKRMYEDRKKYQGFKEKSFIPTKFQYDCAMDILIVPCSDIVKDACNIVLGAFVCNEKVHRSYIHIINSIKREDKLPTDIDFNN